MKGTDALPVFVLMPGMDGTGRLFRHLLSALPPSTRVEIVRYPADRKYIYDDLIELVRARLPIDEPYVLVAESFSTPIAIRLAAEKATNLRALILCNGFAASPVQGWLRPLAALLSPPRGRFHLPKRVLRQALLGTDASEELLNEVISTIDSVDAGVMAVRLQEVLICDARKELGEIDVPILYLRASEDKLISSKVVDEMVKVQPAMKVVTIKGPHLLLQRAPEACVAVISEFLSSII